MSEVRKQVRCVSCRKPVLLPHWDAQFTERYCLVCLVGAAYPVERSLVIQRAKEHRARQHRRANAGRQGE